MILFYFIFMMLMIVYAVLIAFYHRHWNRIPDHLTATPDRGAYLPVQAGLAETNLPRISVIIPMRNEAGNVSMLLQSLTSQNYPPSLTELILVDDHSTDNTWELISAAASRSLFNDRSGSDGPGSLAAELMSVKAIRLQDLQPV